MSVVVVTGAAGLVGSEAVKFFSEKGLDTVGIDNDLRAYFFGKEASTAWNRRRLEREIPNYTHIDADIRDVESIDRIFAEYGKAITCVIHTAAQPSHDWAAREPRTDFSVNATGTLNLLEATRHYCPEAVFIFVSTNKVYGDRPNELPYVEHETRWEIEPTHPYALHGIDESMSIDSCLHSVFGASKVAADIMVQEYGHYFGLNSVCFRGGCLTGPAHSGAELHGFLAYLGACAVSGKSYTVYGYEGKQVRDNIHAQDLINAFWHFYRQPRAGEVYNIGGGRFANCSMLEAIGMAEKLTGRKMNWTYNEQNRVGDHKWWISDVRKFERHYPEWHLTVSVEKTMKEIVEAQIERQKDKARA